ncbi:MAG TPA: hypothetical protein VFG00_09440 [Acidothermaceae bacterium]|nr:hypothetical protein [Acidothermaceae bacterium]
MTTSAGPPSQNTSLSHLFDDWQRASAALRDAEAHGASNSEVLALAEDVLRARVAVMRDRIAAGWQPSDEVMHDLEVDTQLMHEADARGV